MRYVLLSTVAVSTLLTAAVGPASAADVAVRAPAPYYDYAPVPVFTWTGFYIGANAGAAWRHHDDDKGFRYSALDVTFPGGSDTGDERDHAGFTGGLTLGANWQFNQVVLGLEGDINYMDRDVLDRFSGVAFTVANRPGVTFTVAGGDEEEGHWFGTLRTRAGLAWDRFLVYGTAGLALKEDDDAHAFSVVGRDPAGRVVVNTGFTSDGTTNLGWTAGAGAEVGLTANISVKLEYLYVTFDPVDTIDPIASTAVGAPVVFEQERDWHIVRGGVNFKFGDLFGAY
jgi:outer membrane immunogenic protein